ncbi:hypothetical protein [Tuwongella immobilis]|uniref:Uncharacterized protein n=1 Tax=Tuwongella immobilis TaxID=692036 RepID=A0A6C2YVX3_9BACT|nr:hypothetical protein [Tuwongella immobilis]VIP05531.1 unnamed protein product [Tuwongella immobilis]VTS08418.1 unnamed protein product [Tuwongella immobilis]
MCRQWMLDCLAMLLPLLLPLAWMPMVGAEPQVDFATIQQEWQQLRAMESKPPRYRSREHVVNSKGVQELMFCDLKQRDRQWLLFNESDVFNVVLGQSSDYLLSLRSTPPGAPWSLIHFLSKDDSETIDKLRASAGYPQLLHPLTVVHQYFDRFRQTTVLDLPSLPGFTVVKIGEANDQQRTLVFRCTAGSGELTLDPKRHYLPVKCVLEGVIASTNRPWKMETTREVDVSPNDPQAYLGKQVDVILHTATADDPLRHQRWTYTDYSWEPVPEAEFRLSHYGLPEPAGSESAGSASVGVEPVSSGVSRTWYVVGAAVLFVVAGLFRWLARKRNPVAAG